MLRFGFFRNLSAFESNRKISASGVMAITSMGPCLPRGMNTHHPFRSKYSARMLSQTSPVWCLVFGIGVRLTTKN